MAAAGYASIRSGKFGNNPDKLDVDFGRHLDGENAEGNADNIIAFIGEHAGRQPLFLYMASNEPHDPQFAPASITACTGPSRSRCRPTSCRCIPSTTAPWTSRDEATLLWPRTRQSVTASWPAITPRPATSTPRWAAS